MLEPVSTVRMSGNERSGVLKLILFRRTCQMWPYSYAASAALLVQAAHDVHSILKEQEETRRHCVLKDWELS